MKKIQTILLQVAFVATSGGLLTGCEMIYHAFDETPVKSSLVVAVAGIIIAAIIVFLVRMGTRQGDEKAEA